MIEIIGRDAEEEWWLFLVNLDGQAKTLAGGEYSSVKLGGNEEEFAAGLEPIRKLSGRSETGNPVTLVRIDSDDLFVLEYQGNEFVMPA